MGGLWPDWPIRALERRLKAALVRNDNARPRPSAWAVSSRLGAAACAALDRAEPSRPRRWLCGDLSGLAAGKKPACLGCNPRGGVPPLSLRATGRRLKAAPDREVKARPRHWFRWKGQIERQRMAVLRQQDGDSKNLQDILSVNSFSCLLLSGSTRRSRWDGSRATSRRWR